MLQEEVRISQALLNQPALQEKRDLLSLTNDSTFQLYVQTLVKLIQIESDTPIIVKQTSRAYHQVINYLLDTIETLEAELLRKGLNQKQIEIAFNAHKYSLNLFCELSLTH